MAAPADRPTMRMNMKDEVATPRSLQPTLAWIDTTNAVLQNPIPLPITNEAAVAQAIPREDLGLATTRSRGGGPIGQGAR